jgi:hypothetical protein
VHHVALDIFLSLLRFFLRATVSKYLLLIDIADPHGPSHSAL